MWELVLVQVLMREPTFMPIATYDTLQSCIVRAEAAGFYEIDHKWDGVKLQILLDDIEGNNHAVLCIGEGDFI